MILGENKNIGRIPLVKDIPWKTGDKAFKAYLLEGFEQIRAKDLIALARAVNIHDPTQDELDEHAIYRLRQMGFSDQAIVEFAERRDNKLRRDGIEDRLAIVNEMLESNWIIRQGRESNNRNYREYSAQSPSEVPAVLVMLMYLKQMFEIRDHRLLERLGRNDKDCLFVWHKYHASTLAIVPHRITSVINPYCYEYKLKPPPLFCVKNSLNKAKLESPKWYQGHQARTAVVMRDKTLHKASPWLLDRYMLIKHGYWTETDLLLIPMNQAGSCILPFEK